QCGQAIPDVPGAHAGDERQPAGFAVRVEAVDQPQRVVDRGGGPELDPDRIAQTRHEVDVRAVELPRALPDPQEVPGAAVDLPGARVDAGERLLVVQQQGLVGGVELHDLQRIEVRADRVHEAHGLVDLPGQLLVAVVPGPGGEPPDPGSDRAHAGDADAGHRLAQVPQRGLGGGVDLHDRQPLEARADRVHEAHGLVDLPGQLLVAVVPGTGGEPPVPGMDLAQVGEAAAGEGAQQVQRR